MLLIRVANDDSAAMRECIAAYGPLVWSLARRFTRCAADAEDATQDVFLKLWRYAHRFDVSKGSEACFVAMIARRLLIDRLRRQALQPLTTCMNEETLEVEAPEFGDPSPLDIDTTIAVRELRGLRPEQRRAIEMAFWDGMTHAEIAHVLRLPLGTVKSYIRRGLLAMRTALTSSPSASSRPAAVSRAKALQSAAALPVPSAARVRLSC